MSVYRHLGVTLDSVNPRCLSNCRATDFIIIRATLNCHLQKVVETDARVIAGLANLVEMEGF